MHFHGRGRREKRHLQRRFLRKRSAYGGRPCSPGGAVAQRLRGFKSAEPKKTVKRPSRRTGVNLQFFFGAAHFFGVKRGEQPLFRGSSASKSLVVFWFSFATKREHFPRRQAVWLQLRQLVQILGVAGQAVLQKPVGLRTVHGQQRGALLRERGVKFVVAAALLLGAFDQRA